MDISSIIDKMSTTDRIKAMEDLWDALTHDKDELTSPDWHGDVLDSRRKKIESGNASFLTIEDIKSRYGK